MDARGLRIGVIMGGPSSEREVSLKTGRGVLEALLSRGHGAVGIDWRSGESLPAALHKERVEIAWIALHGVWGEDGCIQGLLECLGIPYTGSGVMGSAIAMDKVMSRRILEHVGVPTPRWTLHAGDSAPAMELPLVVKPSREGSSVGISIVHQEAGIAPALAEARRHHGEVMVEEFIAGRGINAAILDDQVLGDVEVRPAVEFYTYEAKYLRNDTRYLCPAPIDEALRQRIGAVALAAHRALGCTSYSRVDLMVDQSDRPLCLEVNTLPGMTATSLLPKIAAAAGMDYATLVERILAGASLKA